MSQAAPCIDECTVLSPFDETALLRVGNALLGALSTRISPTAATTILRVELGSGTIAEDITFFLTAHLTHILLSVLSILFSPIVGTAIFRVWKCRLS